MGEKPQKSHSLVQVVFWATECVENDFGFKFLLRLRQIPAKSGNFQFSALASS